MGPGGLAVGVNVPTVTARDAAGNVGTCQLTLTRTDASAPSVAITTPASGSTVSGTITVSALAADHVGVASVQFKLDGVDRPGH